MVFCCSAVIYIFGFFFVLVFSFVSVAINSERKDVYIEKQIYKDHYSRKLLREKLNKNGVFLSNMRRKKYTDDCKSLPF